MEEISVKRILANDGMDQLGLTLLQEAGFEVHTEHVPQDKLADTLPDFDALVVRSTTQVRHDLIDVCPNLRLIGRGGVGMDNIDVEYAVFRGIHVVNTPAASSHSVAELVFGHLIGGVRFLFDAHRKMPNHGTENFLDLKKTYAGGTELRGKTLGIVGFGRIGRALAKIALGVGMRVIVYDMQPAPDEIELDFVGGVLVKVPVYSVSLLQLYHESDFISFHVPYLDQPLLGEAEFELLKDGVGLVNCSRGGVIDEFSLLKALDIGKVAFAGLDVFENEPFPMPSLLKHPKVSSTPHIGASTKEAQKRVGAELAHSIIQLLG